MSAVDGGDSLGWLSVTWRRERVCLYAELRELRLARLLDASVLMVAEVGWDVLSMARISRRSGVPRQRNCEEVAHRTSSCWPTAETGTTLAPRGGQRTPTVSTGCFNAGSTCPVVAGGSSAADADCASAGEWSSRLLRLVEPPRRPSDSSTDGR